MNATLVWWLRAAGIVAAACLFTACGMPAGGGDELDPERFRTAIASAREQGLTVYWVGREPRAGGVVFSLIDPSARGEEAALSLGLHYLDEAQTGSLDVISYTPHAWSEEGQRIWNPPSSQLPGVTVREVRIAERDAELRLVPRGTRGLNAIHVIVEFDDSVVVATTTASITTDGGNSNPLLDETTFLSVLENLRPYPD